MPAPDARTFNEFILRQAEALRKDDHPPASRKEWEERRKRLRAALFAAIGEFPATPCPLEPREVGVLKRDGYRIEKILFQSRPGIQVTASAYVPESLRGKAPAVLVVHGHWAGARRDPVVQARCLGLVHLGFFVLAVDAFGAGERHPKPAPGAYHGALLGSTLWPAGQSLLGMQVYDNRRAVDYLRSRPEVDGDRLGITGASGGGNQTMYAGALDERFRAVVPVCSVGRYQAYLRTACCVCEVVPGALQFTEEGDVLGLTAPRALMVVNATMDGIQFSVGEARKSLERTSAIYDLYGVKEKLKHATFESPHAYNQAMRETMYGWMTQWLKEEGKGDPIPEPKHTIETAEDLACFSKDSRPATFVFPFTFAHQEAMRLLEPHRKRAADHKEAWESQAMLLRALLREVLGGLPPLPPTPAEQGTPTEAAEVSTTPVVLEAEAGLPLSVRLRSRRDQKGKAPACVVLHFDGKAAALDHPLTAALVEKGWVVATADLRATGASKMAGEAIAGAADHHSAEHGVWIGRPLLGQWVCDVRAIVEWLASLDRVQPGRIALAGIGPAALVALAAAAVLEDHIDAVAALDVPVTLVTDQAYPSGFRMGLLAPGLFKVGDVPQLAALASPRRLLIAGGITLGNEKLLQRGLDQAFAFTRDMYRISESAARLSIRESAPATDIVAFLSSTRATRK
jgi:cephalosporin-C deacetylase-like acetyl esterase